MELEAKIEHYMIHLAKENDSIIVTHTTLEVGKSTTLLVDLGGSKPQPSSLPQMQITGELVLNPIDSILEPSRVVLPVVTPTVVYTGALEPANITLEFLSINPKQGKRFSFIDDIEETLTHDPTHDLEFGPSQHEGEAFEDA